MGASDTPQKASSVRVAQASKKPKLTFEAVVRELRKKSFGIISTISESGNSHSTGVCYGVSTSDKPFEIYIMSEPTTKKAVNISSNPNVSFVVPILRPILTMVPPACIQLQGKARVLESDDEGGRRAFQSSYLLRMLLNMGRKQEASGAKRTCFIRITPDPVIHTYGVGLSVIALRQHIAEATARVVVPKRFRRETEA